MKNIVKKSILSKMALFTVLITTGIYANENEGLVQDFGAFVYAADRNLTDFFSQNNKTPFNTYLSALEKLFSDFQKKIETSITRAHMNDLTKEIQEIIDYTLYQFNIGYNIMKKYCGKPANEAAAFGAEINRDFNPQKVFGDMITKLKVLRCKASQAGEDCLVKKIETVITMIEKKRKEWNAKSDMTLFVGLSYRMNCK